MGELRAENLNLSIYDEGKLRENLPEIRSLTLVPLKEIIPRLVKIGEQCGVAFLFVRKLTGFPVHGLVRWIGDHPFIQVGLRYKRHDILWFTIFHEIGHILLHGRREIFIESKKAVGKNRYEDKADKFAEDKGDI